MNNFTYAFTWQGDLHLGVPAPNESSELVVYAPGTFEVEIGETIIESGQAVIPVRLHNTTGKPENHEIKFVFEEVERKL